MALPAQISSSHVGPSECPLSISLALTGGQQPETSGKEKGLVNFSFIDFMPPRPPHPEFPDPNFDVAAAVKANEPLYRIYQMMSLLSEQYGVVFCPPLLLTSNACRFRILVPFELINKHIETNDLNTKLAWQELARSMYETQGATQWGTVTIEQM